MIGAGWELWPDVGFTSGYYVHRGSAYLSGVAFAAGAGVTPLLLTGLPEAIRPPVDTPIVIQMIVPDPQTPGVYPPTEVGAIVQTNGDVVLDSPPPFLTAAPNGALTNIGSGIAGYSVPSRPDFTAALAYLFLLGSMSWPVDPFADDGQPWVSLAPFIQPGWEDIDAQIAVHGTRVHLRGRVRALFNGGSPPNAINSPQIFDGLPAEYLTLVTGSQGIYTIAAGTFAVPIRVYPDGFVLPLDDTRYSFRFQNSAPPGLGPQYIKLPWDAPGPPAQSSSNLYADDVVHPGGPTFSGLGSAGGLSAIAGAVTVGTTYSDPTGADYGGSRAQSAYPITYSHTDDNPVSPGPGASFVTSVTATWRDKFDALYPEPDWVVLQVLANGGASTVSGNALAFADEVVISADGAFQFVGYYNEAEPLSYPGTAPSGLQGWVRQADGVGDYPYDPYSPFKSLLWRPGDLPVNWTVALSWHAGFATVASVCRGGVGLRFNLIPLWQTRRNWIMAGDVLDLAGAGWQAPMPAPIVIPPGTLAAGSVETGIVRRGR